MVSSSASADDGGILVPEGYEVRAREVLLTDERLRNSGVSVLLLIPAGTGRQTAEGFIVPAVGLQPSE